MGHIADQQKRVLVTGGAGFLGSHLCSRLLGAGSNVVCIDNFSTGSKRNVAPLLTHTKFEIINRDITASIDLDVDEIYNLASPASPAHYEIHPIETIRTSVYGAMNALELAYRRKCRIFQASTCEVYGDLDMRPQPESYLGCIDPLDIRACYGEAKRCAETLFFSYYRQNKVQVKVGRLFNTYGPNMNPSCGRVVSNFIVQALKGDQIRLYGDGKQKRSFCYVDDVIDGIVKLMASKPELIGPINIGSEAELTILELAEMVIELVGSRSELIYSAPRIDDVKQRRPDIGKARSELNWEPRIPLRQGLEKTIVYFDKVLSEEAQA